MSRKRLAQELPDLDRCELLEWSGNKVTLVHFVGGHHEREVAEAVREVTAIATSCAAVTPPSPTTRRIPGGWEVSVTFLREAPQVVTPFDWCSRPAGAA